MVTIGGSGRKPLRVIGSCQTVMVPVAASKQAAAKYHWRVRSGVPADRVAVRPGPAPSRNVSVPLASISRPKPVWAASFQVPMIACRPFAGVVGMMYATNEMLPVSASAGCGGTAASEPTGIDWKRPECCPLQGASIGSGANRVASGPASGCFSRTSCVWYWSVSRQLTMKCNVSPGATLH